MGHPKLKFPVRELSADAAADWPADQDGAVNPDAMRIDLVSPSPCNWLPGALGRHALQVFVRRHSGMREGAADADQHRIVITDPVNTSIQRIQPA